jgi:hypothetical protein
MQVAACIPSQGILIVQDLSKPGVLVSLVELALSDKEGGQLVSQDASVCCAYRRRVPSQVIFGPRALKIVGRLELVLVTSIFVHIFVILEVSGLEILLECFGSIRTVGSCWPICRRLLGFGKGPLGYSVVDCGSFLKYLTIEDVLTIIRLIHLSLKDALLFASNLIILSLVASQLLIFLDLFLAWGRY